ncbi:MAG: FAD-binding domain-containing protein [Planktomarina sp.]
MSSTLLWFKRDLRIHDNAALVLALGKGRPVVPLYVVEPDYWQLPDTSGRQWDFTAECLVDLQNQLGRLGQPLVIRVGKVLDVFEAIHAEKPFTRIISHEETGNLWTFGRDRAVAAWAKERGVKWEQVAQSGVTRRLDTRDGWAAAREWYVRDAILTAPKALEPVGLDAGSIPTAAGINMKPDLCPDRQKGGRGQAMSLLGGFLTDRGRTYRKDMSSPLMGEWTCSRISPYLALGVLSGREAARAAAGRKAEVKGTREGWGGSISSFTSRLAWRDHFMQKLEDEPRIENRCLHSAYANMRVGSDPVKLQAWTDGQTGIPFVDACMRYLTHTGWINFRMRSMLQAVASYHLWLDWRDSGLVLARRFTDYEPGIHWSQVQMQSGTTGMNTVRVYNPVKQGYDQDPKGVFTRRWVPELQGIADEFLQEPWKRGGWKGYAPPIVDVKAAAKDAKDKIFAVRKHASRKEDHGMIRDALPTKDSKLASRKDDGQMSFDL